MAAMVPHSRRHYIKQSPRMLADCRMRWRREWGTMAAVGRRQPPCMVGGVRFRPSPQARIFGVDYMAPEWICIILFYGWSSYVISFGLRQYLDFVPYIIEQVPKYLGWRGNTFFSQTCNFFRGWFDFYTNSYVVAKFVSGHFCCFLAFYVLSLLLSHVTVDHSK